MINLTLSYGLGKEIGKNEVDSCTFESGETVGDILLDSYDWAYLYIEFTYVVPPKKIPIAYFERKGKKWIVV